MFVCLFLILNLLRQRITTVPATAGCSRDQTDYKDQKCENASNPQPSTASFVFFIIAHLSNNHYDLSYGRCHPHHPLICQAMMSLTLQVYLQARTWTVNWKAKLKGVTTALRSTPPPTPLHTPITCPFKWCVAAAVT